MPKRIPATGADDWANSSKWNVAPGKVVGACGHRGRAEGYEDVREARRNRYRERLLKLQEDASGTWHYLVRLAATVVAVTVVMYVGKTWFVDPIHEDRIRTSSAGTAQQPLGAQLSTAAVPRISWRDAADHYQEYVTVEGEVVASHNSGKACFLNFHPDYHRYFSAVIFASSFDRFPPEPEDYYLGRVVEVSGRIEEYRDAPEIVLENPEQITIVK